MMRNKLPLTRGIGGPRIGWVTIDDKGMGYIELDEEVVPPGDFSMSIIKGQDPNFSTIIGSNDGREED